MAKAKKMENEVTVAETKEVGFSDLELTIKKPSLGKDGTMVVGGNFEELAGQIAQVVQKYKGTVLTEDNVNYQGCKNTVPETPHRNRDETQGLEESVYHYSV